MKKLDKRKIEEFIRVDHAGERGAVKIYEGQLLALNTFVKNDKLKETIEEMKIHEKEHRDFFEEEIKKRNIAPTKFLPLWDLLGVGLGFGSTLLGKKAAMLCTASVEEVIDEHYLSQINQLDDSEKTLKSSMIVLLVFFLSFQYPFIRETPLTRISFSLDNLTSTPLITGPTELIFMLFIGLHDIRGEHSVCP